MDFEQARNAFEKLVDDLNKDYLADFFSWLRRRYFVADCSGQGPAIAYSKLRTIANDIKELVPLNGIMPSEKIYTPTKGENADCDPLHTAHMDAFLYEEYEIDDLVMEGKMSRNYCKKCHSNDVSPLTFTSHSASMRRLEFIFRSFLPSLTDKTVLDVGSRLGAMLYAAYVYTKAPKIIGVEMNKELCNIQKTIIEKHKMTDRIQVICDDIQNIPEVVKSANIVILNNVFEFFLPPEDQVKAWNFIKSNVTKPGTILVTVPSLEDSLKNLETGIDLSSWVKKRHIEEPLIAMAVQEQDELSEVCTYEVI